MKRTLIAIGFCIGSMQAPCTEAPGTELQRSPHHEELTALRDTFVRATDVRATENADTVDDVIHQSTYEKTEKKELYVKYNTQSLRYYAIHRIEQKLSALPFRTDIHLIYTICS